MRITPAGEVVTRANQERSAAKSVEAVAAVPATPPVQAQVDRQELSRVIDKMNSAAQIFNQSLQFKVMDGNRILVKVIDSNTGEVVREFPPEKLIEAFRSMEEHLGVLFDRKV